MPRLIGSSAAAEARLRDELLPLLRETDAAAYRHVELALVAVKAADVDPCPPGAAGCTRGDRVARLALDVERDDPVEVLLTIVHEAWHYVWTDNLGWVLRVHSCRGASWRLSAFRLLDPIYAAEEGLRTRLVAALEKRRARSWARLGKAAAVLAFAGFVFPSRLKS